MCYTTLLEELNAHCQEGGPIWTCFLNDMQSDSGPIITTDTASCVIIIHRLSSTLLKLSLGLCWPSHSCSCSFSACYERITDVQISALTLAAEEDVLMDFPSLLCLLVFYSTVVGCSIGFMVSLSPDVLDIIILRCENSVLYPKCHKN